MDVYMYQADLYCKDCGKLIRKELDDKGQQPEDPDDEATYDSDDYPKGPYRDGGGEADTPHHCAAEDKCINADGGVGLFLENELTTDGYAYVADQVLSPHQYRKSDTLRLWFDHYGDEIDWKDAARVRI